MKEQDIFFDPEKPEENLLDPDTLSNRFTNIEEEIRKMWDREEEQLKKLWDKENEFLKMIQVEPNL